MKIILAVISILLGVHAFAGGDEKWPINTFQQDHIEGIYGGHLDGTPPSDFIVIGKMANGRDYRWNAHCEIADLITGVSQVIVCDEHKSAPAFLRFDHSRDVFYTDSNEFGYFLTTKVSSGNPDQIEEWSPIGGTTIYKRFPFAQPMQVVYLKR